MENHFKFSITELSALITAIDIAQSTGGQVAQHQLISGYRDAGERTTRVLAQLPALLAKVKSAFRDASKIEQEDGMEKFLVEWYGDVSVYAVNMRDESATLVEEVFGRPWMYGSWVSIPDTPTDKNGDPLTVKHRIFDTKELALAYAENRIKENWEKALTVANSAQAQLVRIRQIAQIDRFQNYESPVKGRHMVGCQGNHPDGCFGDLWECEGCGKSYCYAEGMDDDQSSLCDECWGRERA